MSDGQVEASVRTVTTGERATATMRIDDDGDVLLSLPAPGSAKLDPEVDLPDFLRLAGIVGETALTLRRERKRRRS